MRPLPIVMLGILWAASAWGFTLSGRVTDTAGGGVHPLDIDVYVSGTPELVFTPDDTTDAQGFYSMELPEGTYDVAFKPLAGSHLFRRIFPSVNLFINTTLDAILPRGHYLTGRVTDPQGQGVEFVDIDFRSPATGTVPNDVQGDLTDALGFFTALVDSAIWDVSVIAPIDVRLAPRFFPAVDLRADQSLGTVALDPGFAVQGSVTDGDFFPIADADIDVRLAGSRSKLFTPQDNTDASGNYSLILAAGTYDISAAPSPGQPYADATARAIGVAGDTFVPNIVLPPGFELRGRCKDPGDVRVANVDLDVDSLPLHRRLETENDFSDANGDFRTLVSAWKFRVTLSPPVSARLLPVRFDSLEISGQRDLGDIVFPRGHWVSGTVVESGSNGPIAGANLDFIRKATGVAAVTPGDVTDGAGFFRVVTDQDVYRLRVVPPSAAQETLVVDPFSSVNDTTVTLTLARHNVSAPRGATPAPGLSLASPRPNPAAGDVSIGFSSAVREVELGVWDVAGRRVATLYRGPGGAPRTLRWDGRRDDGRRLLTGIYQLRLSDGREAVTRRMVLLR